MLRAQRRATLLRELASFVRGFPNKIGMGGNLGQKKAPLFRAGLFRLGVRRDASQCRLQVFDKGRNVLDLACVFRLRLLDHLSKRGALDAFP